MSKIKLKGKYKSLLTSPSRYFICTGGRGSGKSFGITVWVALLLYFEKGHTILFTRYTLTSAHISIIPEFKEKLEMLGIIDDFEITKDSIICTKTGSSILFRGIKTSSGTQTANLKSISGVTTWILDESEELTDEETFDKINLSIRVKGIQNRVILILNPTTKAHFIYRKFFEEKGLMGGENLIKEDTTYIHTTYLDNLENLSEDFIKEVERMKLLNPKKYNHVILGGWLDKAEGVIFTNWNTGEFNHNLNYGFGMDFGFSIDPTTLIRVAIDTKLKKIYLKEELYKTNLTTSDIASQIKHIVGNKEIIADNAEGRLITELEQLGFNIKACKKGAGSVVEGLTIMQDYEIIIDPTSINLIKEFNNYAWSNKKAGQPIDKWNHGIDASRYRISHITDKSNGYIKRRIR
jgi:phage terminase large subunit